MSAPFNARLTLELTANKEHRSLLLQEAKELQQLLNSYVVLRSALKRELATRAARDSQSLRSGTAASSPKEDDDRTQPIQHPFDGAPVSKELFGNLSFSTASDETLYRTDLAQRVSDVVNAVHRQSAQSLTDCKQEDRSSENNESPITSTSTKAADPFTSTTQLRASSTASGEQSNFNDLTEPTQHTNNTPEQEHITDTAQEAAERAAHELAAVVSEEQASRATANGEYAGVRDELMQACAASAKDAFTAAADASRAAVPSEKVAVWSVDERESSRRASVPFFEDSSSESSDGLATPRSSSKVDQTEAAVEAGAHEAFVEVSEKAMEVVTLGRMTSGTTDRSSSRFSSLLPTPPPAGVANAAEVSATEMTPNQPALADTTGSPLEELHWNMRSPAMISDAEELSFTPVLGALDVLLHLDQTSPEIHGDVKQPDVDERGESRHGVVGGVFDCVKASDGGVSEASESQDVSHAQERNGVVVAAADAEEPSHLGVLDTSPLDDEEARKREQLENNQLSEFDNLISLLVEAKAVLVARSLADTAAKEISCRNEVSAQEEKTRAAMATICIASEESAYRASVAGNATSLQQEWMEAYFSSKGSLIDRLIRSIASDEASQRNWIVVQEGEARVGVQDIMAKRRVELACRSLSNTEAAEREALVANEEDACNSLRVSVTKDFHRCQIIEFGKAEASCRREVASEEAFLSYGLNLAKKELWEHRVAEAFANAVHNLLSLEVEARSTVNTGEARGWEAITAAARLSYLGAQLAHLPKEEAQHRVNLVRSRETEVDRLSLACLDDYKRAARAVVERRETARRRLIGASESTAVKQLMMDCSHDRCIAEATTAYRTNRQHNLAVPLPPAALRQLKCLLEEEEDERELLLRDEGVVRRKQVLSAVSSVCASEGGVNSVHEASLTQDARPRITRDRYRGPVTNDALQRWVRFNR